MCYEVEEKKKNERWRKAKTTRQEGGLGWRARGEAKSEVGANVPGAGGGEDRRNRGPDVTRHPKSQARGGWVLGTRERSGAPRLTSQRLPDA